MKMNKKFWLWVTLLQIVFVLVFYNIFQINDLSFLIFAAAAIVQFILLLRNMPGYFLWFTGAYAVITIFLWFPVTSVVDIISILLWFFWIALFNYLIHNMLRTEQYEKLFFGSFILWIIAFGAIYAIMDFINILVLKIDTMPAKIEISSYFMSHMKLGIVMGLALGLGYDINKLINKIISYKDK